MQIPIIRVLLLMAMVVGAAPAQGGNRHYPDPFEKFFTRLEKHLVAQTQVLKSMATLLRSSLEQGRLDRQERGRLGRRLLAGESKRKLAVQGTRLDALAAEVKLLRQRTEQLVLRTQALENQVTSLKGRLAASNERLDLLTGEMQKLKKKPRAGGSKPPPAAPPKGGKKKS